MSRENGSRFSVLERRLGISKSVLSRHLDVLERFGWIARNPGHGHPLRPEYLLSAAGRPVAAWCERLVCQRARLGLEVPLGRWSLPLLFELVPDPKRFTALQTALQPITPRALSLTLGGVQQAALVTRTRSMAEYALTPKGRAFAVPLLGG